MLKWPVNIKMCSTVIRKCKLKPQGDITTYLSGWPKSKRWKILSDMRIWNNEKSELLLVGMEISKLFGNMY